MPVKLKTQGHKKKVSKNFEPKIIDRYSKFCSAFCPSPNSGTIPKIKNSISVVSVQMIFVLKETFFSVGAATSGNDWTMFFIADILY